jgi:hypothetical protein
LAPSLKRYARQIILREIGQDGQARLQRTNFDPGQELTSSQLRFCTLYAERAGLLVDSTPSTLSDRDATVLIEGPLAKAFRHSSSRDIAIGAGRALQGILQALNLATPHSNNVTRTP